MLNLYNQADMQANNLNSVENIDNFASKIKGLN
jgi:hypothetical protein